MKKYLLIPLMIIIGLLQGCGSGRTTVLDPVKLNKAASGITIVAASEHTANIKNDDLKFFEKQLATHLYKEFKMTKGNDITMKYRFIQFNPGSRFKRYMLAGFGNSGEASTIVEFTFLNKSGVKIGLIHAEGRIGSGIFGGSIDEVFDTAAQEGAAYAHENIPMIR